MPETQYTPVTYEGRIVGQADISDDGTITIKFTDDEFYREFFVLFEKEMAPSFSISPHIAQGVFKTETHTSDTLNKVYAALATDCGWSYHKTVEAINAMRNAGIIFRERL